MNISITNECNRRCRYCFQKDWYLPKKANDPSLVKEMSVDLFTSVILWYMKSYTIRHDSIRLLGGEPLLHSKLDSLLGVLSDWNLPFTLISNISVDSSIISGLVSNNLLDGWLINSDYPSNQRDLFLTNFELLCKSQNPISVSTTLIPDSKNTEVSAYRILELIKIYKSIIGNTESFNIRLSPATPNPNEQKFELYDYSVDLCNFFNIVWSEGQTQAGFDCKLNYCELSPSAITAFKESGIRIYMDKCSPETCPIDVLVDGSVIWCSSINKIRLDSIADSANYDDCIKKLKAQWIDYWTSHKMYCSGCVKYNPAMCSGLCVAKNDKV